MRRVWMRSAYLAFVVAVLGGSALDSFAAVGFTAAGFSVSPGGGAIYSVPLTVPHGVADLQPSLSLDYSSEARSGLAGIGWNLSGVASITRCPRTKRQDGVNGAVTFSSTDRFCLNGQRLVLDGSSTYGALNAVYRTEGETFSRITALSSAVTGQAYFKMETKSGLVYEFGNTALSLVKPGPATAGGTAPTVPLLWAVNKISDRLGNSMDFTYKVDATNGSYVIDRITYNAGKAYVLFNSSTLANAPAKFLAGTKVSSNYRLDSVEGHVIDSGNVDSMIKKYVLTYKSSDSLYGIPDAAHLISIQECGASGGCLPPLSFEWSYPKNTERQYSLSRSIQSVGDPGPIDPFYANAGFPDEGSTPRMVIDLNGDGLLDYVGFKADGVHFSLSNDYNWLHGTWPVLAQFGSGQGWTDQTNYPRQLIDINGDGYPDIVGFADDGVKVSKWDPLNNKFLAQYNALSKFGKAVGWIIPYPRTAGFTSDDYAPRFFADMNGDGFPDIVGIGPNGVEVAFGDGTNFGAPFVALAGFCYPNGSAACGLGTGWTTQQKTPRQLVDMNGDGYPDLVGFNNNGVYVALWNIAQNAFVPAVNPVLSYFGSANGWTDDNVYPRRLVDVNGDGYPDAVGFAADGVWVALWNGTAFQSPVKWTAQFAGNGGWSNEAVNPRTLVDINNDGYADIVGFGGDGIYVLLNTGSGFVDNGAGVTRWSPEFGSTNPGVTGEWFNNEGVYPRKFVDYDGDGIPDVVAFGKSSVTYSTPFTNVGTRITAVVDSLGARTDIQYSRMTGGSSYYTKGSGTALPKRDVVGPLALVTKVSRSNGVGGQLVTRYRYGGLRAHRDYGSLGFEWSAVRDEQSGIETLTTNSQSYPFTGQALISETAFSAVSGEHTAGDSMNWSCSPGIFCQKQFTLSRNSTPLSRVTNTPAQVVMATAGEYAGNSRIFTFISQTLEQQWDPDGTSVPTKTTTYTYDTLAQGGKQWGAITKMVVSSSDGHATETNNTYTADEPNWLVAKLQRATVKDTRPLRTANNIFTATPAPAPQPTPQALQAAKWLSAVMSILLDD